MRVTYHVARILLGVMLIVVGLNGFLHFLPQPPPRDFPQNALAFNMLLNTTGYGYLVFGTQVICGVLFLVNRYVPLAVVVMGAVFANIITFHLTMWPQTLVPMPILVLILWFLAAWPIRRQFTSLFASKVEVA